jgi:hypothetical protein
MVIPATQTGDEASQAAAGEGAVEGSQGTATSEAVEAAGTAAAAEVKAAGGDEAAQTKAADAAKAKVQEPTEIMVPMKVVKAMRKELKGQKVQIESLQQTGAAAAMFQPPQQAAAPVDPFKDISDSDVMTGEQVKNAFKVFQDSMTPMMAQLQHNTFATANPGHEETIRTYLPEMISANPGIAEQIRNAPNQIQAALAMAKLNPKFAAAQTQNLAGAAGAEEGALSPLDEVEKLLANANKPGSPSQLGGAGGAISGKVSWADASDEEFEAKLKKVKFS